MQQLLWDPASHAPVDVHDAGAGPPVDEEACRAAKRAAIAEGMKRRWAVRKRPAAAIDQSAPRDEEHPDMCAGVPLVNADQRASHCPISGACSSWR